MTTRHILTALAAAVLAACGDEQEAPPAEAVVSPLQVLPNIALPPAGQVLSREGGAEAATLLISTPVSSDSVVEYYRDVLSKPPYRLMNESVNSGRTSFYVEQDGPPLWVVVEGLEAGGTLVRMTGAVKSQTAPPDSTPAAPTN